MTRWTRCLLLGAIAVLIPVLAGCEAGANAPTQEFHEAANGVSTAAAGITIDDAFVLGPALNSVLPAGGQAGVFLSIEAQNGDQLTKATASGAASVQLVSGPVTLAPNSVVNLSGPQPQLILTGLTAPLSGGQTVSLSLYFASAGKITITVPVEPSAYDYTSYSPPPSPTAAITPTPFPSPTGSPSASPAASASPSATAS